MTNSPVQSIAIDGEVVSLKDETCRSEGAYIGERSGDFGCV